MGVLEDINANSSLAIQQRQLDKMKEVLEPDAETNNQQQVEKPRLTYAEMLEKTFAGDVPPTPEQQEAERKRQRRNAVISAIGDGISALSNLYFTSKGAPNSYDPKQGLSAKLQERYDKYNKERKAREREYRSAYLRAQALDRQEEEGKRRQESALEKLRQQQKQWEAAQKLKERAQTSKEENARVRQQQRDQEIAIKNKIAADRAAGRGGYARGGRGGGSSSNTTTETYDKNGNLKKTVVKKSGAQRPQGNRRQGSLLPGQTGKGGLLPKK